MLEALIESSANHMPRRPVGGKNMQTRRTYSAEELRKLKSRMSEPRLSETIDELDGDDAEIVKEHVLRGARSFAARSNKSRQSTLRIRKENSGMRTASSGRPPSSLFRAPEPMNSVDHLVPAGQTVQAGPDNLRPSPTPSLRRKKIESLVQTHGSPPHVRVTAGGRVVPSEQSPLCHPRYGYSAIKANGGLIKFAPNHPMGKAQWTRATQNGFVAQDTNGCLCQIVGGAIMPLTEVDGALRLYLPAPNLQITQSGPSNASLTNGNQQRSQSPNGNLLEPSPSVQIKALEQEYAKLEAESKEIDKTEAIHSRTMNKSAKDALYTKRRELVTRMDSIRRALKSLKDKSQTTWAQAAGLPSNASPPRNGVLPFQQPWQPVNPPNAAMPPFVQAATPYMAPPPYYVPFYAPPPVADDTMGQPWVAPPPNGMADMYASGILPRSGHYGAPAPGVESTDADLANSQTSTVKKAPTAGHVSHAIPIKAPDSKVHKSALNPESPVYLPKKEARNTGASSPLKPANGDEPSSKRDVSPSQSKRASQESIKLNSAISNASFQTADFFPRDTQEYSIRRYDMHYQQQQPLEAGNHEQSHDNANRSAGGRSIASQSSRQTLGRQASGLGVSAPQPMMAVPQREASGAPSAPDREMHNLSPKSKRRGWILPGAQPNPLGPSMASSIESFHRHKLAQATAQNKTREYLEGFQCGLMQLMPDMERSGHWIKGYCAALVKLKEVQTHGRSVLGSQASSLFQSAEQQHRRSTQTSSGRDDAKASRQSEITVEDQVNAAKQAILAPSNEMAVMSPRADDPSIDEITPNLGAWGKKHENAISKRLTSAEATQEEPTKGQGESKDLSAQARRYHDQGTSKNDAASDRDALGDGRLNSMTSIDSALYPHGSGFHNYGNFGPQLEYRSMSSVAQYTGMMTAPGLFDGSRDSRMVSSEAPTRSPHAHPVDRARALRLVSPSEETGRESFDVGESGPRSPLHSPRLTSPNGETDAPPSGKCSPARARMEMLAGKVGIKSGPNSKETTPNRDSPAPPPNSPTSPSSPGKRRWLGVWRRT